MRRGPDHDQLAFLLERDLRDKIPVLAQGSLADHAAAYRPPTGPLKTRQGYRKAMGRHAIAALAPAVRSGRILRAVIPRIGYWDRWRPRLAYVFSPDDPPTRTIDIPEWWGHGWPETPPGKLKDMLTPFVRHIGVASWPDTMTFYCAPSTVERPALHGKGFGEILRIIEGGNPTKEDWWSIVFASQTAAVYTHLVATEPTVAATWELLADDIYGPEGGSYPDALIRRGEESVAVRGRMIMGERIVRTSYQFFYPGANETTQLLDRMRAENRRLEFWNVVETHDWRLTRRPR